MPALIALNSRIAFLGDSLTAGSAGRAPRHWCMFANQSRLYPGPGTHLGVGGERLDQMLARIAQAVNQKPAVTIFNGGTNDLTANRTLQQMQDDDVAITNALIAAGSKVIRQTIPRSTSMAPAKEAQRLSFNAWLAARPDISVADLESYNPADATVSYDGTHPTAKGAKLFGDLTAAVLNAQTSAGSILFADQAEATAAGNLEADWNFAGTSGAKTGSVPPTGEVATGWTLQNNTSATVTAAKTMLGGAPAQRFDVSGMVTAENTIRLFNTVSVALVPGQYFSAWADLTITRADGVSAPLLLKGLGLQLGALGSSMTATPDGSSGPLDFAPLSGVLRMIPAPLSGTGASVVLELAIRVGAGAPDIRVTVARIGVVRAEQVAYGVPTRITTGAAPATNGTAAVGSTLTCTLGTWTGGALAYSFQWQRDGGTGAWTAISGATAQSYGVTAADSGSRLRCALGVTNSFGSGSATTLETALVA
ncbi:MAG: GDSL-type esterase/lipase family protein [Beijerinckiaceae bacterium]